MRGSANVKYIRVEIKKTIRRCAGARSRNCCRSIVYAIAYLAIARGADSFNQNLSSGRIKNASDSGRAMASSIVLARVLPFDILQVQLLFFFNYCFVYVLL